MTKVPSGTISETRQEREYLGHWRLANDQLMVKLGLHVETVPARGMAPNAEAIARRVFAGMINRHVAKISRKR
jgi:hypothetical protein